MINFKQNGYGLIEVIVVSTLGIMVFLGVSGCLNSFLKTALLNIDNTEALFLAKSSLEQARAVRDEGNEGGGDLDWVNITGLNIANLDAGDPFYFEPSLVTTNPTKWISQAGTKSVGKYTVWITVSEVQRDDSGGGDIVLVGTYDPNTVKITSNVSWSAASGVRQISLYEYLTNFR